MLDDVSTSAWPERSGTSAPSSCTSLAGASSPDGTAAPELTGVSATGSVVDASETDTLGAAPGAATGVESAGFAGATTGASTGAGCAPSPGVGAETAVSPGVTADESATVSAGGSATVGVISVGGDCASGGLSVDSDADVAGASAASEVGSASGGRNRSGSTYPCGFADTRSPK